VIPKNKKDRLVHLGMKVSPNERNRIQLLAARDGRSVSNYVRKIIQAHFRLYDEGKTNEAPT